MAQGQAPTIGFAAVSAGLEMTSGLISAGLRG